MSTPEQEHPGAPGPPSEEELRAYEAELARITTSDVILQVSVSLLNLGARRLAPAGAPGADAQAGVGGRDLEQVRDAIDAVRALLGVLERRVPQELAPLRDALSQLQMAYARELGATAGSGEQEPATTGAASERAKPSEGHGGEGGAEEPASEQPRGPGPAQSSGRLWVPGQ